MKALPRKTLRTSVHRRRMNRPDGMGRGGRRRPAPENSSILLNRRMNRKIQGSGLSLRPSDRLRPGRRECSHITLGLHEESSGFFKGDALGAIDGPSERCFSIRRRRAWLQHRDHVMARLLPPERQDRRSVRRNPIGGTAVARNHGAASPLRRSAGRRALAGCVLVVPTTT